MMLNIIANSPTILAWALFGSVADYSNNETIIGYDMSAPDVSFILPDTLREISGLTTIDTTTFACIQDENGILFIYDAITNEIKSQYAFHIDGDYEGITRVGNTMYVLRSDGTLFEVSDYQSKEFRVTSFATGIPANNNEGLCYDADNNRLLIACKGKIGKGSAYQDKRLIYGFDLKTKALTKEPVFDFDLQAIKQFALENKINLRTRTKKKGQIAEPIIRFATSAICIHPLTKKLYLLSASDHLLFIFDGSGNIEHMELLNPVLFNKAEGISFFENGNMLITNEAQSKKPTLLQFNYRKK